MVKEELDFEKLKLVYDKVAENHRYYLSWRRYILAGAFAVCYALYYSSYIMFEKGGHHLLLAASLLCVNGLICRFFFLLEKRNTALYHVCQRVGSRIEQVLFSHSKADSPEYKNAFSLSEESKDNVALFFTLDNSYKHSPELRDSLRNTHSYLLEKFYNIIFYTSISGSVILLTIWIVKLIM